MLYVIISILFVIALIVYIKFFKTPRIETINMVSGGLGSGKTSSVICRVKRQLFRYYFLFRNRSIKNDYVILSSFPVGKTDKKGKRYLKVCGRKIYCYDLTLDLLLLQKKLPQNEVILIIDEFSNIASQFDFNNPVVKDNIDEFIRNFRHYTQGKGYIYAIDQCSNNIFLQVRRRGNYVYNMQSCFKIKFLPIIIFTYRKIFISDEVVNQIDVKEGTNETELCRFIFLCNPFKWYDSYAYSDRYQLISKKYEFGYTTNVNSKKRNDVLKLNIRSKTYYETLIADNITETEYLKK